MAALLHEDLTVGRFGGVRRPAPNLVWKHAPNLASFSDRKDDTCVVTLWKCCRNLISFRCFGNVWSIEVMIARRKFLLKERLP